MKRRATPIAAKDRLAELLRAADIDIDGSDPWDLHVLDDRFFARVLTAKLDRRLVTASTLVQALLARTRNLQVRTLSRRVARRHYDLSNDLYIAMLGPTSRSTFDEQAFWTMYDRRAYEALKRAYDPNGRFPGLYEKTVGRS